MTLRKLQEAYRRLAAHFGPQHWWPADTPFEVMVGAILTQNTSWANVEKAIRTLKTFRLLHPAKLAELDEETIQEAIRPAGYFRQKARRLKVLCAWLLERTGGDLERLNEVDTRTLRSELLELKGIGPETADSILLYALGRPVFVVDTYTYRVLTRHGWVGFDTNYEEMRELLEGALPKDTALFNEFHALFVAAGKEFCRKTPRCERCPLEPLLPEGGPASP